MIKVIPKGSKLIFIFILTVIVSGGILAYLSITHISNYRELLEKKISEEQQDITTRFSLDFQKKLDELTLNESLRVKQHNFNPVASQKRFDSIAGILNYVIIDSNSQFIRPFFINNPILSIENKPGAVYFETLREAQNNEFRLKNYDKARSLYLNTLKVAGSKLDSANVYNSMARLFVKMNLQEEAIDIYQILLLDFKDTFNSSGFPYSYFSVNKLLQITDPSSVEQIEDLLYSFLKGLANNTIPLNDSSSDLLNDLERWAIKYQNSINLRQFKALIDVNRNSLLLINNYKSRIENTLKVNNNQTAKDSLNAFSSIKPVSGDNKEMMLIFKGRLRSVGVVIGLAPLFSEVLNDSKLTSLKFEYNIDRIEKKTSSNVKYSSLIARAEFSPYFEDSLIQVSLKNENIIDQKVLSRKITYGIGLCIFLGIMMLGLHLLVQDVKREKKMNKLRADFVSNVTHELKTPLTSINMFAEAMNMSKDKLDPKHQKYTAIIVKESEKLKRMINNILEFSKKENDKMSYKIAQSNVTDIVKTTLSEMNYFLEINKIETHTDIAMDIYADVHVEGMKLALSNLISNAIKYSATNKKVCIRLYQRANEIFIEVEDFGIGIPENELDSIFDKFYRVNSDENETASGTGLGLTVTKDIIEEQNGKLWVESTLGKGSKFTIVLNAAKN